MEIEERLREILQGTSWVREVDVALRVVPALAADLPPLVRVVDQSILPVACATALLDAVEATLLSVLPPALAGRPREAVQDASPEELAADPLVSVLCGLMAQTGRPELGTRAVPALACAWAATQLLSRSRGERLAGLIGQLSTRPPAERGTIYASVVWSLSGRVSAAAQRARSLGYAPRTGGLTRVLFTTPLLLAFPAGTLRASEDLATAAAMAGIPIDAALVGHLTAAVRLALEAAAETPETPAALEVASLTRGLQGDPLFTPHVGPRLLGMLPDLLQDSKARLSSLPAEVGAALTSRSGAAAASSAWDALLERLLRWDVLSALCARIRPAHLQDGRLMLEGRAALPPGHPWPLLAPRTHAVPPMTVAAVRLSGLRAAARRAAATRQQPLLAGLADQAWERLVRQQRPDAAALLGEHGIALFTAPSAALAFARAALQDLGGLRRLEAPGLEAIPLPEGQGAAVSVGLATGEVGGVADGVRAFLEGEAAARAATLCGLPHGEAHAADLLGIRRAFHGPAGLHSQGIVADAATVAALVQASQDAQVPLHRRGTEALAGGIRQDFQGYTFQAWWEDGTHVVALLALGDGQGADAVAEIQIHEATSFAELHQTDAALARKQAAVAAPAAAASPARDPFSQPTGFDPFADPEDDDAAAEAELNAEDDEDAELVEEPQADGGDPFLSADPFSALDAAAERLDEAQEELHQFSLPDEEEEEEEEASAAPEVEVEPELEEDDEDGFGFMLPPAEPPAPSAGLDPFAAMDEPDSSSRSGFMMGPDISIEEEDESDVLPERTPHLSAPMMMEDEEDISAPVSPPPAEASGAAASRKAEADEEWEAETRVTPPMILDDDDDSALEDGPTIQASPPMILDDDDPSGFAAPLNLAASYPSVPSPQATGPAVVIDDDDESDLTVGAGASDAFLNTDIARMFRGYVVLGPEQGEVTFGLLDERTLRDAHSYPIGGGLEEVYQSFLRDKLKEGFVPQVHRLATLKPGKATQPMDMGALERAYQKMLG